MLAKITESVEIQVDVHYVKEQSDPSQDYFFFTYRIKILNHSEVPVQLISRHWIITDAKAHVEEVKGPGVVGEQPIIQPQGSFEYSSFCPLRTPTGTMRGFYQMVRFDGSQFYAEIPEFDLVEPSSMGLLH